MSTCERSFRRLITPGTSDKQPHGLCTNRDARWTDTLAGLASPCSPLISPRKPLPAPNIPFYFTLLALHLFRVLWNLSQFIQGYKSARSYISGSCWGRTATQVCLLSSFSLLCSRTLLHSCSLSLALRLLSSLRRRP